MRKSYLYFRFSTVILNVKTQAGAFRSLNSQP